MTSPLNWIALNRLEKDERYYLIHWWTDKYKLPENHPLLLEKTWEELYVDYMVDWYKLHPEERSKDLGLEENTWKGFTTDQYEEDIKKRLEKVEQVDLSQWREEVKKGNDEFDDVFEVGEG